MRARFPHFPEAVLIGIRDQYGYPWLFDVYSVLGYQLSARRNSWRDFFFHVELSRFPGVAGWGRVTGKYRYRISPRHTVLLFRIVRILIACVFVGIGDGRAFFVTPNPNPQTPMATKGLTGSQIVGMSSDRLCYVRLGCLTVGMSRDWNSYDFIRIPFIGCVRRGNAVYSLWSSVVDVLLF